MYNIHPPAKPQDEKVDQAFWSAKARIFGEPPYNVSDQLCQFSDQTGETRGFDAPELQDFRQAIKSRYRRRNAIKEQHDNHEEFNLKADLLLIDPIDDKRFRRRLCVLNNGVFDIVWQIEKSPRQDHYHYHAIIRTKATSDDFRQYISDCLSDRKGQIPKIEFQLNIEDIENDKADGLFTYDCKASTRLIRQMVPQAKGKRTIFTTGKPFIEPSRQLHRQFWERESRLMEYMSDPDRLSDTITTFEDQLSKTSGEHEHDRPSHPEPDNANHDDSSDHPPEIFESIPNGRTSRDSKATGCGPETSNRDKIVEPNPSPITQSRRINDSDQHDRTGISPRRLAERNKMQASRRTLVEDQSIPSPDRPDCPPLHHQDYVPMQN